MSRSDTTKVSVNLLSLNCFNDSEIRNIPFNLLNLDLLHSMHIVHFICPLRCSSFNIYIYKSMYLCIEICIEIYLFNLTSFSWIFSLFQRFRAGV